MKGLDVGYGVLCHRFDMRRAGQHQQFNCRGRRSWGQEVVPSASGIALSYYGLWPAMIRSGQIVSDGLSTQPEESGNKDYDDHDADDVKNVHCALLLRHARLQYESTMLQ